MQKIPTRVFVFLILAVIAIPCSSSTVDGRASDSELGVSFKTEQGGGSDPGFVVGTVENGSRREYTCVRIEYELVTRFDQRQQGETARTLGSLVVIVEGVEALSTKGFREALPFPAGVRLGSIGECEATTSAPESDQAPAGTTAVTSPAKGGESESESGRENKLIEQMEEEAKKLEPELKELESGGEPTSASFDEADSRFGRRTETVAAERGQRASAPGEGDESSGESAGMGSIHSDEAPPEVFGIDESDNVRDHREPGKGGVTDHREAEDRPGREPRPTPRQDAESGSDAPGLKGGLGAPSDLTISDVSQTTLTLSWRDNSTAEFGVEVYRIDPVKARRDRSTEWEFVGTFEERVQSRVQGTGERSDQDFGLAPDTNYCYRLRSYRGFDRSAVSLYSESVCAKTEP